VQTFLARQPIFDRRGDIYGYELLFRSEGDQTCYPGGDDATATREVVANTLFSIGLEKVLCGKRAFLNFDRSLLSGNLHQIFSKDDVVIEVLETVQVDESVIAACSDLHKSGFAIALDDFAPGSGAESLLPFAKIIKVDMRLTPRAAQQELLRAHLSNGMVFLAEKVETQEEFQWTRDAGYDLFQGHFFEKPEILSGKRITSAKIQCLELLRQISASEIDCRKTAAVIERDVGLSYKLLRYVNSALVGLRQGVSSIDHAVVLLGSGGLRQWAAVAAIPTLASDKPAELAVKALVRAQFCERLAKLRGLPEDGGAFMVGLFSHLDAMLDLPICEALSRVHLSDELTAIILESTAGGNPLADIFQVVRDYESALWEAVTFHAAHLRLTTAEVTQAYAESTFWTAQAAQWTSRKNDTRSRSRRSISGSLQILCDDGEGAGRVVRAELQNISETGMQLRSKDKLPVRAMVTCNDAKTRISGRGVVRYCQFSKGAYLIGVEFSGGTGWRDPLGKARQAH
jgi:c-di-GMP-related signal transduction protein